MHLRIKKRGNNKIRTYGGEALFAIIKHSSDLWRGGYKQKQAMPSARSSWAARCRGAPQPVRALDPHPTMLPVDGREILANYIKLI